MISGLLWAPRYTAVCTALTALLMLLAVPTMLARGAGWVQAAMMLITPWLLAAQRQRIEALISRLQAAEAASMIRLSGTARGLLSLQHAAKQIETQIAQMSDLYHVTKDTTGALRLQELFTASLAVAPRFLDTAGWRLIDCSREKPQAFRAQRMADGQMSSTDSGALLPMEQAVLSQAGPGSGPSMVTAASLGCAWPAGLSHAAWAPLSQDQRRLGVLIADALPESQMRSFGIVANQLSLQCSRIALYQQVESLAVTDALTGLFVRSHFLARAQEELARSARHGLSCALLMVDLDRFKDKNDQYGHLVGDVVLKDVARLLQRNLREIDLIARFGGEELILLLIETSAEQAMPITERLRQLVEVHPVRAYDELLTQTVSIGLAGFPDDARSLEALIERADQALYAAKHAGRNRVVRWSDRLPGMVETA